ncbi:OmpA family protein [Propioniciclava soli]|uniref:OmpA family protein n=1 Tax=Propioniciclava soli TaxID=2775081 RepID=A0ABZ3C6N4_9ACTN
MKRLASSLVALAALAACTTGPTPTDPATSTPAPSATAPATPTAVDASSATELVRQGAEPLTTVLASIPLQGEGSLTGATLDILEVRVTDASTVVTFALTHPDFQADFDDRLRSTNEWAPALRAGDGVYWPSKTVMYNNVANLHDRMALVGQPYTLLAAPRGMFALFAPLPASVTEVEVLSPLSDDTVSVPVVRGPATAPEGTADIPALGQVTYADPNDADNPVPVTVTVHGVRRVEDATVLYYSAVLPEGSEPQNLATFGGGSTVLAYAVGGRQSWPLTMGVVDHANHQAHTVAFDAYRAQVCSPGDVTVDGEVARTCWAAMPGLPENVTRVDVIIGGQQAIQDVPVEDGPLTPTIPNADDPFPVLGGPWPEIPAEALAVAARPDQAEKAVLPLVDVVTEDAVTTSGQQLDLDTTVLFAYNEATLTPEANAVLTQVAEQIQGFDNPGQLTLTGHTDADGSSSDNLDLSRRRAQAVADALAPLLGDGYTFAVDGKGEADPIAPNTTETGKALNRRVTILPPS